jgi:hypothetical protein
MISELDTLSLVVGFLAGIATPFVIVIVVMGLNKWLQSE